MAKRNQQYFAAIAVLVIVLALVWYFKTKPAGEQTANPANTQNESNQSKTGNSASATTSQADVWMGVLKKSDATSKGNLMLVTKERNIYFKTVRDFSALIDKNVNVTFEGSLQGFTLLDITAAQ